MGDEAREGLRYWRGMEELLETPEFRAALEREFPAGAELMAAGMSRRGFVKLLGASVALAGVGACAQPAEHILPYVDQPPELTPGVPLHYATAMTLGGYATGLLVESHEGRPTKVEGNPQHPASLGAAGVYEQASVLGLYDPRRLDRPARAGRPASWADFRADFLPAATRAGGAGLALLLEPTASPLRLSLLERLRARLPAARVHFHAPLSVESAVEGAALVHGRPLRTRYDLSAADVVVAADADVLAGMPFHLRYAHDFASRRHLASPDGTMNRLYALESGFSPTGATADHRLRVRTGEIPDLLAALLAELADAGVAVPAGAAELAGFRARGERREWLRAVAADLRGSAGRSAVVVGERQPPEAHALGHLINAALGSLGRTVHLAEPVIPPTPPAAGLPALVEAMRAGEVHSLLVLEANPAYTAPADLELAAALAKVERSACLDLFASETTRLCRWSLPALHYLESWGDGRAYDGTVSFVQPLVKPLRDGRTPDQLLAMLAGEPGADDTDARALLRDFWRGHLQTADFESAWSQALQLGLLPDSAAAASGAAPRWEALPIALQMVERGRPPADGLELVFRQDPALYDGRFAPNAWLQELPDPVTKLTWDNAALLSPATAERLGVDTGEMLRLRRAGRELRIPALVLPGHADDSLSLGLGYGRRSGEGVEAGVGFDAYRLRTRDAPYVATGVEAEGLGEAYRLASTQTHWAMHGRPIVLGATLAEYRENPDFTAEHRGRTLSLYQPFEEGYATGNQWAMAIDLSLCTGCSACVVACQAENNVPVVGKEGVLASREMHWLRIDRYFAGGVTEPTLVMQPMLCQHCEQAPCEYVCPVNATVHSPEGLNEMVYNRCVGTRFCSNNCPYKVRRFNWFNYTADLGQERLAMNPDVTVRARGVMEKCTFCVQRIRRAEIAAQVEERRVRPGEVKTACQQACPTQAIVFGSYTDPEPELAARLAAPRRYSVLHELGTEPRVRYLARITNPNPALEAGA